MQVHRFSSLEEIAPYAEQWDRLARGVPFRGWTWLSGWWECYGPASHSLGSPRLYVLGVFDPQGRIVGLGPWYLDRTPARGRVLRLLGSGEVSSDYLGVLCEPGLEEVVAAALARRLCQDATGEVEDTLCWDRLELNGVDAEDHATGALAEELVARGCRACPRPTPHCWRIELPDSWEAYLAMLSKRRRRQFRHLVRDYFDSGRVKAHFVRRVEQLPLAMDILIDLHQRRWQSQGQPGCFASPRFERFLRETAPRLLAAGRLLLVWLELDGRTPLAAEFALLGESTVYSYQSGVEPDAMQHQPGHLGMLTILRWAIGQGFKVYDLLRGDEPYKRLMRAQPRPAQNLHLIPNRTAAILRHRVWLAGANLKQWWQGSMAPAGSS